MPLNNRLQQIALSAETTEGVAVSPVAGDVKFNIFGEPDFTEDIDRHERQPIREDVGQLATLTGIKKSELQLETELVGSGSITEEPPFSDLLKFSTCQVKTVATVILTNISGTFIAGEEVTFNTSQTATVLTTTKANGFMYITDATASPDTHEITGSISGATADGGTYATAQGFAYFPDSSRIRGDGSSCTVSRFLDGKRTRFRGARGNVNFSATTGNRVVMNSTLMGAYNDEVDAALLSGVTYPAPIPPQLLSTTLDTHGFSKAAGGLVYTGFQFNSGNNLEVRDDAGSASGAIAASVTGRQPAGSFTVEAPLVATHDFRARSHSTNEDVISLTIGSTPGNRFIFQFPNATYGGINEESRANIAMMTVDFGCNVTPTVADRDWVLLAL